MKKCSVLIPCVLVTCFLIISKAISANINPEIGAPVDPGYMGGANTVQQYSEPEDVRRPTDEPPAPMPEMTSKMMHDIEVMEVRHFRQKMPGGTSEERLTRLEEKLTGRSWSSLPLKDRMRRIRLASQRVTLQGTSIPANLRGVYTPNRISNDSIPLVESDDNVGIIDGLMRLYKPQMYNTYKARKDSMLRYQD